MIHFLYFFVLQLLVRSECTVAQHGSGLLSMVDPYEAAMGETAILPPLLRGSAMLYAAENSERRLLSQGVCWLVVFAHLGGVVECWFHTCIRSLLCGLR